MIDDNMSDILEYISKAIKQISLPHIDEHALDSLIEYYHSLPEDITNSDVFNKALSIDAKSRYEDVQWITSYEITYVNTEYPEKYIQTDFDSSTDESEYIQKIVNDKSIGEREKIVVLLSVFEPYLHSKVEFDSGCGIRDKFCNAVKKDSKYSAKAIALSVILAIVRIVYARTDNEQFDRRLPHRNVILHNGTLSYSEDEITTAYKMLLVFICIIDEVIEKQ